MLSRAGTEDTAPDARGESETPWLVPATLVRRGEIGSAGSSRLTGHRTTAGSPPKRRQGDAHHARPFPPPLPVAGGPPNARTGKPASGIAAIRNRFTRDARTGRDPARPRRTGPCGDCRRGLRHRGEVARRRGSTPGPRRWRAEIDWLNSEAHPRTVGGLPSLWYNPPIATRPHRRVLRVAARRCGVADSGEQVPRVSRQPPEAPALHGAAARASSRTSSPSTRTSTPNS